MMIVLFTSRPLIPMASASTSVALSTNSVSGTLVPRLSDLVAVVGEDDVDEVLADVVHVALHRADHDAALPAGIGLLHVRLEERDGRLHRLRALEHERELHVARREQVADHLHPVEQHVVDDRQAQAAW